MLVQPGHGRPSIQATASRSPPAATETVVPARPTCGRSLSVVKGVGLGSASGGAYTVMAPPSSEMLAAAKPCPGHQVTPVVKLVAVEGGELASRAGALSNRSTRQAV